MQNISTGGYNALCNVPRWRGIKGVESSKTFIIIKIYLCKQLNFNGDFLHSAFFFPPPVPSEPPPPAEEIHAITTVYHAHPANTGSEKRMS